MDVSHQAVLTVADTSGIHLRPTVLIVGALRKLKDTQLSIRRSGELVDLGSTVDLTPAKVLGLGVKGGEEVEVITSGTHSVEALRHVVRALSTPLEKGISAQQADVARIREYLGQDPFENTALLKETFALIQKKWADGSFEYGVDDTGVPATSAPPVEAYEVVGRVKKSGPI